jgi:hypothetical protein
VRCGERYRRVHVYMRQRYHFYTAVGFATSSRLGLGLARHGLETYTARTEYTTHSRQTHIHTHKTHSKMPPCIEKARAIMRVLTVDMYNHKAKHERTRLWRMYCSPQIKAYTPDGGESTGYEEVRPISSFARATRTPRAHDI